MLRVPCLRGALPELMRQDWAGLVPAPLQRASRETWLLEGCYSACPTLVEAPDTCTPRVLALSLFNSQSQPCPVTVGMTPAKVRRRGNQGAQTGFLPRPEATWLLTQKRAASLLVWVRVCGQDLPSLLALAEPSTHTGTPENTSLTPSPTAQTPLSFSNETL